MTPPRVNAVVQDPFSRLLATGALCPSYLLPVFIFTPACTFVTHALKYQARIRITNTSQSDDGLTALRTSTLTLPNLANVLSASFLTLSMSPTSVSTAITSDPPLLSFSSSCRARSRFDAEISARTRLRPYVARRLARENPMPPTPAPVLPAFLERESQRGRVVKTVNPARVLT
jgi:hypothetical protein